MSIGALPNEALDNGVLNGTLGVDVRSTRCKTVDVRA
jgi:hypothetical protein